MSYTYHNWAEQATPSLRLERLRLHVGEVSALLSSPDSAADGYSASYAALQQYHASLLGELRALESSPAASGVNGGWSVARIRSPR